MIHDHFASDAAEPVNIPSLRMSNGKSGLDSFVEWAEVHPVRCMLALFFFHLVVSSLMYAIACSPYLTSMHNGHGLWNFAGDSFGYHREALRLLRLLQSGDVAAWWEGKPIWPHVKWIALTYFLCTPYPIAFSPVNALTWVLTGFVVYSIAKHLIPHNRSLAAMGALFFLLMPSYFLQTTQLLRDSPYILAVSIMLLGLVRFLCIQGDWKSGAYVIVGFQISLLLRPYMQPLFVSFIFVVLIMVLIRLPSVRPGALVTLGILVLSLFLHPIDSGVNLSESAASVLQDEALFSKKDQVYVSTLIQRLNGIAQALQAKRNGFDIEGAGSKIDMDVHFTNWVSCMKYIPRALSIGLFAPFPSDWLQSARTAGKGSRFLAGAEMLVLYLLMLGFGKFLINPSLAFRLRCFLLVFVVSGTVLLAMAVPNLGAIYRMRYVFLLPVLIGGVSGWQDICVKYAFLNKRKSSEA